MTRKESKKIRAAIREKDIPVTRSLFGAKLKCRRRFKLQGNPQWAFKEEYGVVILDKITVKAYNYGRKKNKMSKLRTRDMDRMSVFRHPRINWFKEKES